MKTTDHLANPVSPDVPIASKCRLWKVLNLFNRQDWGHSIEDTPSSLSDLSCPQLDTLRVFKEITIKWMTPSSSPPDITTTKFLLKFLHSVAPCLLSITSSFLSYGCVPDYFKTAIVQPLLRNPGFNPSDHRPISKLPFLSKILQKIVSNQLLEVLIRNNIFRLIIFWSLMVVNVRCWFCLILAPLFTWWIIALLLKHWEHGLVSQGLSSGGSLHSFLTENLLCMLRALPPLKHHLCMGCRRAPF